MSQFFLLTSNSTAFSHKPNPDKPKNYDNNTQQWIRWKSCNSYYYYYDGNAIIYAFFKSHLLTIYQPVGILLSIAVIFRFSHMILKNTINII